MAEPARTVVVAEDHPLYRRALLDTVAACRGWSAVAATGDGDELPELVCRWRPTVVLLDLKLPRVSGWELIDRLQGGSERPAIVVVTSFRHPLVLTLARQKQVAGLVSKEDDPAVVQEALAAVAAGGGFYTSARFLAEADTGRESPSGRETEVLRAIAGGATGKEIAARLAVNIKTVETYRARLMRKLGCGNAAELTRVAVECGLV